MKIFCVGRNYMKHVAELGNQMPTDPVIFMKPKTAIIMPHVPFYYPEFTNELHYEAELALRICKNGRYINEKAASSYYDSITVGIDFTARDLQSKLKEKGLPWEVAKSFDNSAYLGQWMPLANYKNSRNINFALYRNDELVQRGNSYDMTFSFEKIIAYISTYFSVNIGDIIFTGTPEGVGEVLVGDELVGMLEDDEVFTFDVR